MSEATAQRRLLSFAIAGVAVLAAIAFFMAGRAGSPSAGVGPTGPSMPPLSARVSAVQTGSVSIELAEDPKGAFVAVFAKTPDGSLERLKPRVANGRSLTLDVQPGSEWLLVLLGGVSEEPGGLNTQVMNAVHQDPGINAFPMLPGVARVARLEIPPSVP
jgi:hypothetical protein